MTPTNTREPLLNRMRELSARGIDCRHCAGECCTSKTNSMQITAREARDIMNDLRERELLNEGLIAKIRGAISEYRLDVEIPSHGSRPNLRRTYTCPLFSPGPRGCLVRPENKPLGCLGFNAVVPRAAGLHSGCRSDQALLAECAGPQSEGEKAPIPVMLWREIMPLIDGRR